MDPEQAMRGYLECALWTGTDESDETGGDPLEANYSISDFDLSSVQDAARDCARFEQENTAALEAFYVVWSKLPDGDSKEAFAGHNFWLTRNGHGAGFWDRQAGDAGKRLTDACKRWPERHVYVNDSGELGIE